MKTLVRSPLGVSTFIFDDSEVVSILGTHTVIGEPANLIVCDLNNLNARVFENVTPPEDWFACKYLFDGTTWTLNPDWVDPTATEI